MWRMFVTPSPCPRVSTVLVAVEAVQIDVTARSKTSEKLSECPVLYIR
jgi:hypothetical protein